MWLYVTLSSFKLGILCGGLGAGWAKRSPLFLVVSNIASFIASDLYDSCKAIVIINAGYDSICTYCKSGSG